MAILINPAFTSFVRVFSPGEYGRHLVVAHLDIPSILSQNEGTDVVRSGRRIEIEQAVTLIDKGPGRSMDPTQSPNCLKTTTG